MLDNLTARFNSAFIQALIGKSLYRLFTPPSRRHRLSFQLVSEPGLSFIRLYILESFTMSASDLGLNHTFIFNGTNYDIWKIRMLNHFRVMDPCIERILDRGFSYPKDSQRLSLEDKKNFYLEAQAINVLHYVVSNVVLGSLMPPLDINVVALHK